MPFIKLFIALALPSLNGYLFTGLLTGNDKETGFFEKIFLGYGIGLGFLAIGIFLAGVFRVPYTFLSLLSVQTVLFLVFACLTAIIKTGPQITLCGAGPIADFYKGKRLEIIFVAAIIIWIAGKIFFVLYEGLTVPLFSWDTWANWSAGAKFFYYKKGLVLDPSNEHFFGNGYRAFSGHPLLSPLIQVWIALCEGGFHEVLAKAWAPFYFICILGLFFITVKRETSFMTALLSTLLLSSAPILTYHGTDGYSDLPMSYYAFAGVASFWRYIKTGNKNLLTLSGILIGIGMFTKNEGVFFAAAIGIAIIVFVLVNKKASKYSLLYFLAGTAITSGPWIIFKILYGLDYGHDIKQKFIGAGAALYALKAFASVLLLGANFNLVFAFLLVTALLDWKALMNEGSGYLFMMLLLVIAAFFSVYISSSREFEESLLGQMAVNRNMLTCLPIAYFISAIAAFRMWSRPKAHDQPSGNS